MSYLFLQEDYNALLSHIESLRQKMNMAHEETAESTMQTSETWHDNFVFEEGQRQLKMLSTTIAQLSQMADYGIVVSPPENTATIEIGSVVTIRDIETEKEQRILIGSYMMFGDNKSISYASPLGQLLLGGVVGEVREGLVGPTQKSFRIFTIE